MLDVCLYGIFYKPVVTRHFEIGENRYIIRSKWVYLEMCVHVCVYYVT